MCMAWSFWYSISLCLVAGGVRLPCNSNTHLPIPEMKNSFQSPAWGDTSGDEIPYIYKHSIGGSIGVEYGPFVLTLSGRYKGDTRSERDRAK